LLSVRILDNLSEHAPFCSSYVGFVVNINGHSLLHWARVVLGAIVK